MWRGSAQPLARAAAHARVPRAAERAFCVVDGPVLRDARVAEAVLAPACASGGHQKSVRVVVENVTMMTLLLRVV